MRAQKAINSSQTWETLLHYILLREQTKRISYIGEGKTSGMMTMTRFSFVMLLAFLFIMILTGEVSAIRLNEIEANPEGTDSGNEWVELYSQDSVNLEGYFLENGDGGIYNLS